VSSWGRFWRLPARERVFFLRAAVLLPLTAAGLRLVGFRRWQAVLARLSSSVRRPPRGDSWELARSAARMVEAANRHGLARCSCLEKSVVLWWLLRREAIACELRIGVRKQADHFEAHAWVEHRSAVLNDAEDVHRHYTAFKGSLAATQTE